MIGEIRQNFTEASASVGLILATALISRKSKKNDCDISRFEMIIELQLSYCINVCDVGQEFIPKRYASCEMHATNANKGRPLGLEADL